MANDQKLFNDKIFPLFVNVVANAYEIQSIINGTNLDDYEFDDEDHKFEFCDQLGQEIVDDIATIWCLCQELQDKHLAWNLQQLVSTGDHDMYCYSDYENFIDGGEMMFGKFFISHLKIAADKYFETSQWTFEMQV